MPTTTPRSGGHDLNATTRWRPTDALVLILVMIVAGTLRFLNLEHPGFLIFDEDYYVRDACAYVVEGRFFCGSEEATIQHPPLGKWLIAAGIWMFTPTAFGSRVVVALFGTLSVGVLFLLARRLLRSTAGAVIASGLLAFDFLHLVVSRTAILDVFPTFFVLLAFLFLMKDFEVGPNAARAEKDQVATRYWLSRDIHWARLGWRRPLAGVAIGLAIASKWTAAPMMLSFLVLVGLEARRKAQAAGFDRPLIAAARKEGLSVVVWLMFVPALVYSVTFVGRLEGAFLAMPWSDGSWYRALFERQLDMFQYHVELRRHFTGDLAPFQSSPAWSWPLIQRPIPFAFAVRGGQYREVLALGNPLVWWPALAAVAVLVLGGIKEGRDRLLAVVVSAGLAGSYVFWVLLGPGVTNLFIYYFVATVPFLCLAAAAMAVRIGSTTWGRFAVGGYLTLVVASFAFFYPVLTWGSVAPEEWRARVPFTQCDPYEIGDKEVVAGYPLPIDLFGRPIAAYPTGVPDERHVPLLTTRAGWCWR